VQIGAHRENWPFIERAADPNLRMMVDISDPAGRTSWRSTTSGSQWATSPDAAYIRANVRYSPDSVTSFDRVNNTVGVTIDPPAAGAYTIRVAGYNIPQGPQPYALVVSAANTSSSYPETKCFFDPLDEGLAANRNALCPFGLSSSGRTMQGEPERPRQCPSCQSAWNALALGLPYDRFRAR
jgi:hypothetical protein